MDPFLQPNASYLRLLEDYQRHGSLVVAFDFDNTVFDYTAKGHTYNQLIDLLKRCSNLKFYLICFTANESKNYVAGYLNLQRIPYNSINENPPFFRCEAKKIYYNILLDDRAGLIQAYTELDLLVRTIEGGLLCRV